MHESLDKVLLKAGKSYSKEWFLLYRAARQSQQLQRTSSSTFWVWNSNQSLQAGQSFSESAKTEDLQLLDLISARIWMTHYTLEISESYCCDARRQSGFVLILYWLPLTNHCCDQFFVDSCFQNSISVWESVWNCHTRRKNGMIGSPHILWS